MDIKLKKRIIGFLLLIGFGLILIPLFFGRAIPEDELKLSSHVPEPPAASKKLSVPIPDSAVTVPDVARVNMAANPAAVTAQSPDAIVFEQIQSTPQPVVQQLAAKPTTNTAPKTTQTTTAPVATAAPAPVETSVQTTLPTPAATITTAVPAPSYSTVKATTQTKKAIPSGKVWVVQLGSFSDKSNADNLVKKLQTQGFKAYKKTTQTNQGQLIRVLVGPELMRTAAQSTAKKIKDQMQLNSIVISMES